MACENCDDETLDALDAALVAAASAPQSTTVDGMTVTSRPIKDLIELDRYQRSKCAGRRPGFGLRLSKIRPGGPTD